MKKCKVGQDKYGIWWAHLVDGYGIKNGHKCSGPTETRAVTALAKTYSVYVGPTYAEAYLNVKKHNPDFT